MQRKYGQSQHLLNCSMAKWEKGSADKLKKNIMYAKGGPCFPKLRCCVNAFFTFMPPGRLSFQVTAKVCILIEGPVK